MDFSLLLQVGGNWNNIAKLENQIPGLEERLGLAAGKVAEEPGQITRMELDHTLEATLDLIFQVDIDDNQVGQPRFKSVHSWLAGIVQIDTVSLTAKSSRIVLADSGLVFNNGNSFGHKYID